MRCSICGEKVIEWLGACSRCGTQVSDMDEIKQKSVEQQKIKKKDKYSFNILGYKITVDKRKEEYASIRRFYLDMANTYSELFRKNYKQRYRNLHNLMKRGTDDYLSIMDEIWEKSLNLLTQEGIYKFNKEALQDWATKYLTYEWEKNFETIYDEYMEIIEGGELSRQARNYRKSTRGRMVGGGFGLGGALKGAAMAGSVNAATGLMHSVGNTIGNMVTSASVENRCDRLFKSNQTIEDLEVGMYWDIFDIHRMIVDLIFTHRGQSKFVQYSGADKKESLIIFDNIQKEIIRKDQIEEALVNALIKYPFKEDIYAYIIKNYKDIQGIIDYAAFFKVDVKDVLDERFEEENTQKRLYQLFGHNLESINQLLGENTLFNKVRKHLTEDTFSNIHKTMLSKKIKCIWVPSMTEDKRQNQLQNTYNDYASIGQEIPLILFDNTLLGSGKNGLLITNNGIYNGYNQNKWHIPMHAIRKMKLENGKILINDQFVDQTDLNKEQLRNLFELIQVVVVLIRFGQTITKVDSLMTMEQRERVYYSKLGRSQGGTLEQTVQQNTNKQQQKIEQVKHYVLNQCGGNIRNYLFIKDETDGVKEKEKNILEGYARLQSYEEIILIFDNTVFGTGKKGFVITNKRLISHSSLKFTFSIDLQEIESIKRSGGELIINNKNVSITMIDWGDRDRFLKALQDIVAQLKE